MSSRGRNVGLQTVMCFVLDPTAMSILLDTDMVNGLVLRSQFLLYQKLHVIIRMLEKEHLR
jgi:hypothetical protein